MVIIAITSAPYAKTVQRVGTMKMVMAPGVEAIVNGTNVIKMMMMMVSQEPVH